MLRVCYTQDVDPYACSIRKKSGFCKIISAMLPSEGKWSNLHF